MHFEENVMRSEKTHLIIIVIGLSLSVLGFFLPWAQEEYLPVLGSAPFLLGAQLWIGWVSFAGCVVAAGSFLFRLKNAKLWRTLVLAGGLLILFSSLALIVFPDLASLEKMGYISYKASFGAYVSLLGSILMASGAISEFHQTKTAVRAQDTSDSANESIKTS
jgi:hypothetical protein